MTHRRFSVTLVCALSLGALSTSCSSSDDTTPASGSDAGASNRSDASSSPDASTPDTSVPSPDAAVVADSQAPPADAAATGPTACSYSVSGERTEPTTNAVIGCANGRVQQPNGSGDYTFLANAAFTNANGENYIFTCTLSSPTPPAAGSVWTLTKETHSQGNCELDVSKGSSATIYKAVGNDAVLVGSLKITFASATMTHGTSHPEHVYYTYDVAIESSLKGQTAGAQDVSVSAHFKNSGLPLGS